jgi:hypothetical protein
VEAVVRPLVVRRVPLHDERGLISGLLLKAVLAFAILALAGHEAVQLVIAQGKAHTAARAAAQVGANELFRTGDPAQAQGAAVRAADEAWDGAKVTSFLIDDEGVVTVTTRLEASTLVVRRMAFIEDWGIQHGTERAARQH